MNTFLKATVLLTFIFWVMIWPLVAIWALNTLFALGIAYTFWNWLAMVVLTSFFGRSSIKVDK
jgi:hypothetical protein